MPVTDGSTPAREPPVNLKDPVLAGILACVLPGLGHWYQGRRAKAILFFVCIMGLFVFGVYRGGNSKLGYGRAVYFAWNNEEYRLYYLCQIGMGVPALPALVQAYRMNHHQQVRWGGFMAPPAPSVPGVPDRNAFAPGDPNSDQPTLHLLNRDLSRYFELASFFTMVAGLLNVLVIYDACAGPFILPPAEKKTDD
jgi:hypothetical protein